MLASKYRFHGYGSLKYLFGHGTTCRFKNFSLRAAPNSRRKNSRVAVVVSKKVLKGAPKRNKVRRRVYEILRTQWQNIAPAHDILVVVYNPDVANMPHDTLQTEFNDALRRAQLWRPIK